MYYNAVLVFMAVVFGCSSGPKSKIGGLESGEPDDGGVTWTGGKAENDGSSDTGRSAGSGGMAERDGERESGEAGGDRDTGSAGGDTGSAGGDTGSAGDNDSGLVESKDTGLVPGVTLDANELNIIIGVYIAHTYDLTETVSPSNAADKRVTWRSDNPSVATVDEDGVVTPLAAGTAVVTVTTIDGGFTDSCTVTVSPSSVTTDDVTYKLDQQMTVFYPPGWKASDNRIAIIMFHGGGWDGGSRLDSYDVCEYFAEQGLVTFTADYRLDRIAHTVIDTRSAIRWIKANGTTFGINPGRVIAGGKSAGAHLAFSAYTADGFDDSSDDLSISCRPDLIMGFSPALELKQERYDQVVSDIGEDLARGTQTTLYGNIDENTPPAILFSGTEDGYAYPAHLVHDQCYQHGIDCHQWFGQGGHEFLDIATNAKNSFYLAHEFLSKYGYLETGPVAAALLIKGELGMFEQLVGGEKTDLIQPSIVSVSSEEPTMPAVNMVNGSGCTDRTIVESSRHSNSRNDMWLSNTLTDSFVVFDLGSSVDLGWIHLWNFTDSEHNGSKEIEILVSADETVSSASFSSVKTIHLLRGGNYSQNYEIDRMNVRLVKLNILSSHLASTHNPGLAEVRFSKP